MLTRVLEPEVMDTPADAQEYDSMDHRAVNALFVDRVVDAYESQPRPDSAPTVLDLGTGTAQIPIELCRRRPAWRVVAVDLADEMLALGQNNVDAAGLQEAIRLERVDAKQLPFPSGSFSAVMSNSIVHHIAEPAAVLAEACRVLAPGGCLVFRDLLRPTDEDTLSRLVDLHAAGASPRQRQLFADSLRAALSLDEMRELVGRLGRDPGQVSQSSDRHWTWVE